MARLKYLPIAFLLLLLPQVVFAAQTFATLVNRVTAVINVAIPVVVALIVLAFMWGVVRYIFSNADPSEKSNSKSIMLWGLISIFVVLSIWGLVSILKATFLP